MSTPQWFIEFVEHPWAAIRRGLTADHTRPPPFDYHNCARCDSGNKPCVCGNPHGCEYLHARND